MRRRQWRVPGGTIAASANLQQATCKNTRLSSRPSAARAGTQLSTHCFLKSWVPARRFAPSGMTGNLQNTLPVKMLVQGMIEKQARVVALPGRAISDGGRTPWNGALCGAGTRWFFVQLRLFRIFYPNILRPPRLVQWARKNWGAAMRKLLYILALTLIPSVAFA